MHGVLHNKYNNIKTNLLRMAKAYGSITGAQVPRQQLLRATGGGMLICMGVCTNKTRQNESVR